MNIYLSEQRAAQIYYDILECILNIALQDGAIFGTVDEHLDISPAYYAPGYIVSMSTDLHGHLIRLANIFSDQSASKSNANC